MLVERQIFKKFFSSLNLGTSFLASIVRDFHAMVAARRNFYIDQIKWYVISSWCFATGQVINGIAEFLDGWYSLAHL